MTGKKVKKKSAQKKTRTKVGAKKKTASGAKKSERAGVKKKAPRQVVIEQAEPFVEALEEGRNDYLAPELTTGLVEGDQGSADERKPAYVYPAPGLGTALTAAALLFSGWYWVKPVSMFWALIFLGLGFVLVGTIFSTER